MEVKDNINEMKAEMERLTSENRSLKEEVQQLREVRESDVRKMSQIEVEMAKKKDYSAWSSKSKICI